MVLNFGLDVSFDNTWDGQGMQEKAWEVNSTEAHITNDEALRSSLSRCYTSFL
jgi:hypothetical protein